VSFSRFKDLKARGVVPNRPTMKRWQETLGFPLGFLTGKHTRVFDDDEVAAWLEERQAATKAAARTSEARP
jgi:hypothetical protein